MAQMVLQFGSLKRSGAYKFPGCKNAKSMQKALKIPFLPYESDKASAHRQPQECTCGGLTIMKMRMLKITHEHANHHARKLFFA